MPRSKRNRQITLSKVKKTPARERKDELIEKIQEAATTHDCCFLVKVSNQKNNFLKEIRAFFGTKGRLFLGKNNLTKLALGINKESELEDGLSELAVRISGEVGILFVKKGNFGDDKDFSTEQKVQELIASNPLFTRQAAMRSGEQAQSTIKLPAGVLPQFNGAMMDHLLSLGMPVRKDDGVLTLLSDFVVCTEGEAVTVDQCQILKLLGRLESEFRMETMCYWCKTTGKTTIVEEDEPDATMSTNNSQEAEDENLDG